MPVPRLVVLPIPYIIASYALYQLGFAFEKPAWYRKHLADQYTKVNTQPRSSTRSSLCSSGTSPGMPPLTSLACVELS